MFDATLVAADLVQPVTVPAYGAGAAGGLGSVRPLALPQAGQINGRVTDQTGVPLPGVTVTLESGGRRQTAVTDATGTYLLFNVPSGRISLSGALQGFVTTRRAVQFDQRGQQVNMTLAVGGVSETVTVTADTPLIQTQQSTIDKVTRNDPQNKKAEEAPSLNVQNLQRRASGVLPVRMEVPRAGTSRRFVKPLVIDEEPSVTFRYKRR